MNFEQKIGLLIELSAIAEIMEKFADLGKFHVVDAIASTLNHLFDDDDVTISAKNYPSITDDQKNELQAYCKAATEHYKKCINAFQVEAAQTELERLRLRIDNLPNA